MSTGKKNMHINVYKSFIYNHKTGSNQDVLQQVNGQRNGGPSLQWNSAQIFLKIKLSSPPKTWKDLKYTVLGERSHCEMGTYYLIPVNTTLNRTKLQAVERCEVVGFGGGMTRQGTGKCQVGETVPYDTVMVDTGPDTFVKICGTLLHWTLEGHPRK